MNRILLVASFLLVPLAAYAAAVPAGPQDIYVWQRAWGAPVERALVAAAPLASGWRVLAAESDVPGNLKPVAVDWVALAATRRPAIAVVRIDGRISLDREPRLLESLAALARDWKTRGVPLAGLEIDYDCATSKLSSYAGFLVRLKAMAGLPHPLSVTALPTWMNAPDAERVFAVADEIVLQVHAVSAPQEGLFDAGMARRWIDRLDARAEKPFRVALPDYGTRVIEGDMGAMVAVESEAPTLVGGAAARELVAAPAEVAKLLADLARRPPAHLNGVVWFRLPTENDVRIWGLSTLAAVMRGTPLQPGLAVTTRPGGVAGTRDILLVNDGDTDAMLPRTVTLPSSCGLADGINGYSIGAPSSPIMLERLQTALLPAHHVQLIGWMRCAQGDQTFHVRP